MPAKNVPSPNFFGVHAHDQNAGTIMKGGDGNQWVVKLDKNGRHFWSRHKMVDAIPIPKNISTGKVVKALVKAPKKKKEVALYKITEKSRTIVLSPHLSIAAWKRIKACIKEHA